MDEPAWHAVMTGVLNDTVTDVLGDVADVVFDSHPTAAHISRVRLTSSEVPGRSTGIRAASTGWVDLTLFEHQVSTTIFDYDEDPAELEKDVRALALVAHQYLIGAGRISKRRGWIRTHKRRDHQHHPR